METSKLISDGRLIIRTKITIFTLADIFMWLFMAFTFIAISINSASIIFQIRFGILLIAGVLGFLQIFKREIRNNRTIMFIGLCTFSWSLSLLLRGENAYSSNLFLYSFLYMGIGINLSSHHHNTIYSQILFYIVCGITLFRLLVLNEPIRGFLKDGTSYNFISVLLLLYLSYYSVELIQNNRSIPYLAAVIFAWISLLAYGRGGIITGLFFLAFITFLRIRDETNKNKEFVRLIAVLTIITGAIAILLYLISENDTLFYGVFAKFYLRSGVKEPRFEMWDGYISECVKSLSTLLFGADSTSFIVDGNLHNSFFQMHSNLGLIPVLILLYSFIRLAIYSFKKRHKDLLCILLTIIVRSMTDKTAFQGYCEPLFYCLVFTWFNVKEKRKMVSYIYKKQELRSR